MTESIGELSNDLRTHLSPKEQLKTLREKFGDWIEIESADRERCELRVYDSPPGSVWKFFLHGATNKKLSRDLPDHVNPVDLPEGLWDYAWHCAAEAILKARNENLES